jgi:hypothetical protein
MSVGYIAEPIDPLSPQRGLPTLAAQFGLGNPSPYGLMGLNKHATCNRTTLE